MTKKIKLINMYQQNQDDRKESITEQSKRSREIYNKLKETH